jgi:hypothetical protein
MSSLTSKLTGAINSLDCTKFDVRQINNSQNIEWSVYSNVLFDPWPFDLKINKGHLLFTQGCTSTLSLKSIKQRVLKILSGQYIHMSSLTVDLLTSHLLFRMYQCTEFEICQATGSQDTEWLVYSYVQFDPWPFTLKINSGHLLLLLRMYQCTKFEVCQAWSFQDTEWPVYSYVQFHPLPLTYWPQNINTGHWSFTIYQCIKFDICQVKGSQDIKWTVYSYFQC